MADESDDQLLSRVEDAGINASAPPEQRWLDGWLIRFSPAKAKRARCINALSAGRLSLDTRLRLAAEVFTEAGLPMLVRLTRFSQPAGLEDELERRGYVRVDDTRVMLCRHLPAGPAIEPAPAGMEWVPLDADSFAGVIGALRGSPPEQVVAHAKRLALSPVHYQGHVLRRRDGQVLACGQFARESELVGLYDVFTLDSVRGCGLGNLMCRHLLELAAAQGAGVAYLQVEADNAAARHIYQRLGFVDAYEYHYRQAPPGPT